ncbi:MAG: hypothetical protein ACLFR0_06945, partial [Alphaproteobacteria bacterium]
EPDPALVAAAENEAQNQSADNNSDAPATDIPAWDADGRQCQGVPEESLAEFLKDRFGNVYVEDGVREDGVLRLYADIEGDDIGQDDGSFSIVGHPFKQGNPDNGFNENVTCLLGGGENGYPDDVLSSDWYREQFAQAAEAEPEEDVVPETPVPESAPDTGPHPPGPQ